MIASTHKPSLYTGAFGTFHLKSARVVPVFKYRCSLYTGEFGSYKLSTAGGSDEEKGEPIVDASDELDIGPVDISDLLERNARVVSGGPPADGETVEMMLEYQKVEVASAAASSSATKRKPILAPRQNGVTLVGKWTVELELPETGTDGKPLHKLVNIFIAQGSVTSFDGDVIVNAANSGCQGGGGVDGAITSSGGPLLALYRSNLPILGGGGDHRCDTGDAVLTPSGYKHPRSRLRCRYVVHAVGPNYGILSYRYVTADIDRLLVNSYVNTLRRCHEHNLTLNRLGDERIAKRAEIEAQQFHPKAKRFLATDTHISNVGFSLISSGIFRGSRSMNAVLRLGLTGIWEALAQCYTVDDIYMVAYRSDELASLMNMAPYVFGSGVAFDSRYVGSIDIAKAPKKTKKSWKSLFVKKS